MRKKYIFAKAIGIHKERKTIFGVFNNKIIGATLLLAVLWFS